jgi:iron(III) transport system substrate-binding protein
MHKYMVGRLLGLVLIGITGSADLMASQEVNIYSARKEALIKPLLDRFTAKSGIKVRLVTGKADALLKRLQKEGINTPADVLLTTDAGRLHRARQAGVLQAVSSETLNGSVPASYRDPEGYWYGLSLRARTIFVAKGKVKNDEIKTYEDLADPKWKGRICIRSSGNIYNQSLVASMIATRGEARTEEWARGLVANLARKPKGGDRDQIKAAAAGQCDIAVANTYYMGKMLNSRKDDGQRAAGMKMQLVWPNQDERGAHVNISGAAVTKASKNLEAAVKLIEYLASAEAQQWYAESNYEYPVRSGVAVSKTLGAWGEFKADSINLSRLGENNAAAVKLMDRAGWR